MDARIPPAVAAALLALGGFALRLVAPGADALCGPGDFECWDPLETVATLCLACGGAALVALALSWPARSRWWRAATATLAACAAPIVFLLAMLTSPTTECRAAPCVPRPTAALLAGAVWGWAVGAIPLARRPLLAQAAGTVGGALVVLAALRIAGWP